MSILLLQGVTQGSTAIDSPCFKVLPFPLSVSFQVSHRILETYTASNRWTSIGLQ